MTTSSNANAPRLGASGKFKAVCPRHHDVGNDEIVEIVVHLIVGGTCVQAALGRKAAVI